MCITYLKVLTTKLVSSNDVRIFQLIITFDMVFSSKSQIYYDSELYYSFQVCKITL